MTPLCRREGQTQICLPQDGGRRAPAPPSGPTPRKVAKRELACTWGGVGGRMDGLYPSPACLPGTHRDRGAAGLFLCEIPEHLEPHWVMAGGRKAWAWWSGNCYTPPPLVWFAPLAATLCLSQKGPGGARVYSPPPPRCAEGGWPAGFHLSGFPAGWPPELEGLLLPLS